MVLISVVRSYWPARNPAIKPLIRYLWTKGRNIPMKIMIAEGYLFTRQTRAISTNRGIPSNADGAGKTV